MNCTIKISMDNAAFTDSPSGTELARILRDAASKIEDVEFRGTATYDRSLNLRDVNGNTVGRLEVTGK